MLETKSSFSESKLKAQWPHSSVSKINFSIVTETSIQESMAMTSSHDESTNLFNQNVTARRWKITRVTSKENVSSLPSGKHVREMYTPLYPTFI